MKYYLLTLEADPKVIGVRDGVAQVEIDPTGFADKELYKKITTFFFGIGYWQKESFVPNFQVRIECAKILKRTILTDFLSFNPHLIGCKFMLSERGKVLFEQFNLPEHYFYPASIYQDDQLVSTYYLLYCPLLDYDIIDFPQSSFFTGNQLLKTKVLHSFANKSELFDFQQANPSLILRFEKIVLSETFDAQLDLFQPRFGQTYISDRLKQAIEQEKLTGARILEPHDPIIELG